MRERETESQTETGGVSGSKQGQQSDAGSFTMSLLLCSVRFSAILAFRLLLYINDAQNSTICPHALGVIYFCTMSFTAD